MNILLEITYVLQHSKRTLFFLLMAIFAPILFLLLGSHMVDQVVFSGALVGLQEVLREKLLHRYDKAAVLAFVTMTGAAIASYRKAYNRLL